MKTAETILKLARNRTFTGLDLINRVTSDFIELHGDRCFGDDPAIVAGIAFLDEIAITVIAHEKGKATKEKIMRNFGSAHPEGYRKAIRQIQAAEKFSRPIVCFVDTQGAYCGIGAEERGQGRAIAQSIATLLSVRVPVISVLIGEGGSGGALALAAGDEVWMLENSIYSVISPEGCASILWKDTSKTNLAASTLKITARDLFSFGLIEKIIPEEEFSVMADKLKIELKKTIKEKQKMDTNTLLEKRYQRFRVIGENNVCASNG